MKTRLKILVMAVALLAAACPAIADQKRWGGAGRGPSYVADIADTPRLNLTAAQAERIDAIRKTHLKDFLPIQKELAEKSRMLRELWLAHHPDQRRIETLQADAQMVRDRLTERIEAYNSEVYRVLSPEQRAKVQLRVRGQGMGRMGTGMDGKRMGGARREKGRMADWWKECE